MLNLLPSFACIAAALAGSWTQVQKDWDTILLSVAFADSRNGVAPYSDNGVGSGVHVTNDGGSTWGKGTLAPYASLFMGAAAVGNNVVLGGTLDTQYSTDKGNTFNVSKGSFDKFITQNVQTLVGATDDKFFGLTGNDLKGGNGVAVSVDGGQNFKFYNISNAKSPARYGAFASKSTWYVAAGSWPPSSSPAVYEVTSRIHHDGERLAFYGEAPIRSADDGWIGEIYKTSDGGQTWRNQFTTTDYYMNAIDCSSETNCCVTGETDTGAQAGAHILCTFDGETWTEQLFISGADQSLIALSFVSATEAWAGGGELSSAHFHGNFPHTVDGGKTWTQEGTDLKGVYVVDISFPSTTEGFAAVLQRDTQSGLLKYS